MQNVAAKDMQRHPDGRILRPLTDAERQALIDSMRCDGWDPDYPAIMVDGMILDGWHRWCVAVEAGLTPVVVEREITDTRGYVLSRHEGRRHLQLGERALMAAREADAPEGKPSPKRGKNTTLQEAADKHHVSKSSVQQAKTVTRHAEESGDTSLLDAVRSGEVSVSQAASTIRKAEADRVREERRTNRPSPPDAPPLPTDRYDVIYADPPWRYDHAASDNRAVENQYPTMTLDEIRDLKVPDIAAPDSVLYLWATSPKLVDALQVIEAWGFRYRTSMVWVKDRIGMGYHARQRHELLLIATRGKPGTPDPADRPDSVIEAPRGPHSVKPPEVAAMIRKAWPARRRVELFQREPSDGFDGWGNERW